MLTWLTTRNPTRLRKSCAPSSSSTALFRKTQSPTPPSAARPTCRFFWPPGNIRRSTDTFRIAEALREHGCASVKIEVIRNSSHYVADEQPETVAELIARYAKG